MGIFDIIGPVMIGPSSSHTAGAARIGQVAGRILGEPLKEAKITLYGSFAKTGKGHGTDRDSGSIRDALHIAEEKEIPISFALSEDDMGHPNVAKIEAYGKNGAHVTVVGRSLGGGRVLITEIDGYPVEITGEEYTFLTRHHDVPGIVAEVCRALAAEEINISNMRLFRKGKGDEAVMIIHTDQCVSQKLADEIAASNANIVYAMAMDII